MSLYRIDRLTRVYGGRTVLDVAGLDLEPGRVHALLGPNGAGKTTLLEILAFLAAPTAGGLFYRDEPVDFRESRLRDLRREVVMVMQHPVMFSTPVYNNLEFPLKIRKVGRSERSRLIDAALERVGMSDFRDAPAHRLSGGETQRVAIARALTCSPRVMLMDEPTASVDVENRIVIEEIIRGINRDHGISVIFTSHNLIQAARLATDTVFLFNGRVSSSIVENLFAGEVVEQEGGGGKVCVIQETLELPVKTDRTGTVRLSVDPRKLAVQPASDTPRSPEPASNTFRGSIMQLSGERDGVRVLIDAGIPISAWLSREGYHEAPLLVGQEVEVSCPPEAVEIV